MKIYKEEVDEYFQLEKILYGQCFRWNKNDNNQFIGVVKNNVIKIWQEENNVYYYGLNNRNLDEWFYVYFNRELNYKKTVEVIKKKVNNKLLNEIIHYSKGTQILNQDMFEMVISYIISANNNINSISSSIEKLSKYYGKKVVFENKEYYLFPTVEELKDVSENDYREKIRVGFRDKYIYDFVQMLYCNKNYLNLVQKLDTKNAKNELMKLKGVGPKVSDCILLFSMNRKDVFPVDVWIEKVMKKYCNMKKDTNMKYTKKNLREFAYIEFGKYCGIINHYMFYWGRENKIID